MTTFYALKRKTTGTMEPMLYKRIEAAQAKADKNGLYEVVPLSEKGFTSPNVPAQDDDKLRIAIEALAKWEEFNAYRKSDPLALRFEFETEEDRLAAANALDEVFASLKSTAAQEGGSK